MCIETSIAQALNHLNFGARTGCTDLVQSATMTVSGTIFYRDGTVTYDTSTTTNSKLSYSLACLADALGIPTADANSCATMDATLKSSSAGTGSCASVGDTCSCDSTVNSTNTAVTGYTVTNTTIAESNGTYYAFCVTSNTMFQRGQLAPGDPVVTTLTKR